MTDTALSADQIQALFTNPDGSYRFARWNRPIVPIVFGVDDETLTHLKSAIVTTVGVTGHKIEETDPELGANFMWFFCQDWDELLGVPDLEGLIPDLKDIDHDHDLPRIFVRSNGRHQDVCAVYQSGRRDR